MFSKTRRSRSRSIRPNPPDVPEVFAGGGICVPSLPSPTSAEPACSAPGRAMFATDASVWRLSMLCASAAGLLSVSGASSLSRCVGLPSWVTSPGLSWFVPNSRSEPRAALSPLATYRRRLLPCAAVALSADFLAACVTCGLSSGLLRPEPCRAGQRSMTCGELPRRVRVPSAMVRPERLLLCESAYLRSKTKVRFSKIKASLGSRGARCVHAATGDQPGGSRARGRPRWPNCCLTAY